MLPLLLFQKVQIGGYGYTITRFNAAMQFVAPRTCRRPIRTPSVGPIPTPFAPVAEQLAQRRAPKEARRGAEASPILRRKGLPYSSPHEADRIGIAADVPVPPAKIEHLPERRGAQLRKPHSDGARHPGRLVERLRGRAQLSRCCPSSARSRGCGFDPVTVCAEACVSHDCAIGRNQLDRLVDQ
jgi:hypothetical protein